VSYVNLIYLPRYILLELKHYIYVMWLRGHIYLYTSIRDFVHVFSKKGSRLQKFVILVHDFVA